MPLKHTLLRFLEQEPMHGYKLRQHARECAWMYPMANASIYPALHSLQTEGFIDHHSEIHNGRARKVYQITNAGRQELDHWLRNSQPVDRSHRDQTLLKIAMQSNETISGASGWLREAISQLESDLSKLLGEGKTPDASSSEYADLAVAYGVDLINLRKKFLQKILKASETHSAGLGRGLIRIRNSESLSA